MTPTTPSLVTRPLNRRRAGAVLLALGAGSSLTRAQGAPVRIALVPYLSPRAMLTQYEPLRRHLETSLGRPVEFYTASSFAALADSVRKGQQPFTLMPVHLARIAVADWGHVLAVRATRESPVQLLAPRSLGLGTADTLRGRRVVAIDPLSITSLMLKRWLVAQRLEGLVQVQHVPSASSAALALARGDADAMVAAAGQALDIPWLKPDELIVVAQLGSVLTPCFVALSDVPEAELAAFRRAMLSFAASGAAAGASGASYVEGATRDLEPYETYAAEVRRLLAEGARPRR